MHSLEICHAILTLCTAPVVPSRGTVKSIYDSRGRLMRIAVNWKQVVSENVIAIFSRCLLCDIFLANSFHNKL